MKRLLAAGAGAIFQITRSFRRGEMGPLHNREFTLVEWYRPGDSMAEGIQLLDELSRSLLGRGPAERMSYAEAFKRFLGTDPHHAECSELATLARQSGISAPVSLRPDDRDGWLDLLLVERVSHHLGIDQPTILYDYPASQAALARIRPGPPAVAERFELFVSGMELANGYHELLDADELRRRNVQANAQRKADGKPSLPEESRLLAAMEAGLPPSTGVALGFDRVVMLAAGATRLEEVMAFPFDRA
jgi:lysyl-tRNA synthetase class 2